MRKCCDCGDQKPINEFISGTWRCKVCSWFKNKNIKLFDNWTRSEYYILVDLIINIKIDYVNDIPKYINKSLNEVLYILKNYIIIGNKPINLKWICYQCNKEIIIKPCKLYTGKHVFCSHECYGKFRKTLIGDKNTSYKKIKTNCTNCQTEISVIPYVYNMKNRFGDNHNFCNYKCYHQYMAIYYKGDKHNLSNKIYTKEERNKFRNIMLKRYKDNPINTDTKPQKIINNILDNNNIEYIREETFKYYAVDNFLNKSNLIIEVMGDYFHNNPIKYPDPSKLNKMQLKDKKRDKSKNTYIKKYYNINILYLWETDINNNPTLCEKLILLYIKKNGNLRNYHSFNYHTTKTNKLYLNKNIIDFYI